MKVENEVNKMRLWTYMKDAIEETLKRSRQLDAEYAAAYKRCFEGTPEEVERSLYRWDAVHRATRSY
ncbi:MAG: hypothetical protein HY513_02380 [Candidatus Aenigmarchaeota archaeon]|nr:hypothetical protein [Candidatus Aenigmarchaeota archaeon]